MEMLHSQSLAADKDWRRIAHHPIQCFKYGPYLSCKALSGGSDSYSSLLFYLLVAGVSDELENMPYNLERRSEFPGRLGFGRVLE